MPKGVPTSGFNKGWYRKGVVHLNHVGQSLYRDCLTCGLRFKVERARTRNGGKYCSANCYHLSTRGKPGPRNGVRLTKEQRQHLSEVHIGLQAKEKHPNWRGGITSENELIRKSDAYLEWRSAVLKRDNYTCVICRVTGVRLQVDHIKAFSMYPELRLEISNGRTLCIPCHRQTPNWGAGARREGILLA